MTLQVVNYPIEKENEPANGDDSEHGYESYDCRDDEEEEQDDDVGHEDDEEPCTDRNNASMVECDVEDSPMIVGSSYPNMAAFRLAIF